MEKKQLSTRATVEAGLMAAIIVVLMLMTIYVPILDTIGTFLVPIPITILYMRHNLKVTIGGCIVSSIILSMVFDPIRGIVMLIMFSLSGITLGYCFKTDKKPFVSMALLSVVLIAGTILNIVITALIIQKTSVSNFVIQSISSINSMNTEVTNSLKQTYTSLGVSQDILNQIDNTAKIIAKYLTVGGISLFMLLGSVTAAIMDYVVCKSILIKLGYNIKKMRPFTLLYINSLTGAIIALPMALGMFLYGKKLPYGEIVYMGGQILFQGTFLVIGMSVVFYFIKNRFNWRRGVLIAIGVFTVFNPLFAQIYLFVGLADMILDFRKINPNRVLRRER